MFGVVALTAYQALLGHWPARSSQADFDQALKTVQFGQVATEVVHELGPPDIEEDSQGHQGDEIVWRFASAERSSRMLGEVYFRNGVVYQTSLNRIYFVRGCGNWEIIPPTLAAKTRDRFNLAPPDTALPSLDPCIEF